MNMKSKTEWITKTAVMIALLVVLQFVTKSLGQFVTGSCVNFVLASSALICGIGSAATVAVLSPLFAFLLGIGPAFLPIVPGICVGNVLYVLILWLIIKKSAKASTEPGLIRNAAALIAASAAKFIALYLLIVRLILSLLELNEKQRAVLGASFSWPQLVTALIGGTIALLCYSRLKNVIK